MKSIPVKKRPSILFESQEALQEIGSKLNLLHHALQSENSANIAPDIERGVAGTLADINTMLNDIRLYMDSSSVIAETLLETAEETGPDGLLVPAMLQADQDGEIKRRFIKEMAYSYGCAVADVIMGEGVDSLVQDC